MMASCAAVCPRGPDPVRTGGDVGGGWGVFGRAEVKELSFHPTQHVDVVVSCCLSCCFSSSCKTHEVEAGLTPCWTRPGSTAASLEWLLMTLKSWSRSLSSSSCPPSVSANHCSFHPMKQRQRQQLNTERDPMSDFIYRFIICCYCHVINLLKAETEQNNMLM